MQEGDTGGAPSQTSMQNYLRIAAESPGYGLAVLGVFLGFVAPFLLFMLADDVLGISSFCGGLLLIGTVMLVVSISKHSSWRKTYNAAMEVVVKETGIEPPLDRNRKAVAATLSFVAGFILGDLQGELFILGGLLALVFLVLHERDQVRNRTAYETLIRDMS